MADRVPRRAAFCGYTASRRWWVGLLIFGSGLLFSTTWAQEHALDYTRSGAPLASGQAKFLGCAYSPAQVPNFEAYFNQVTPEDAGKWGVVEAKRDVMNWTVLDAAYAFAKENGFSFKMHNLIWGSQQPPWIENLPAAEQLAEIKEWFSLVAARYPDLDMIDVVNEPIHNKPDHARHGNYGAALGGNGSTGWDWVLTSFRLARTYFPRAKLFLNEYSVTNSSNTAQQYVKIIKLLQAENLIDGIGIQAHATETRVAASVTAANLDLIAATGLPIYISELDIDGPTDDVQVADFQRIFPVFWEHPSVRGITLWGYRPGMWRDEYGANLVLADGTEKPAMVWLKTYLDNHPPVIAPEQIFSVSADAPVGTRFGSIAAVDPDGKVVLSEWSLGPQAGATIFAIDAATGELSVADDSALVSSGATSYALSVQVTDGHDSSESVLVQVNVLPVARAANQPPVVVPGQTFTVSAAASAGASFGSVAASDPDGSGLLREWRITGGTGIDLFSIDPDSGQLAVADAVKLGAWSSSTTTLLVSVSDGLDRSLEGSVTIAVIPVPVVPKPNQPPVIAPGQTFAVSADALDGTSIGTIAAVDPEGNGLIGEWEITGGEGAALFAVDAMTGELSVTDRAGFDSSAHTYTVEVSVSDGSDRSVDESVTIDVEPVVVVPKPNEPPIIAAGQTFSVSADAANGKTIGMIAALDPEGDALGNWSITGGVGAALFAIDEATGELTVADRSRFDQAASNYTIEASVSDGSDRSLPQPVTIAVQRPIVTPVNAAPVIVPVQVFSLGTDLPGGAYVGSVSARDPDVGAELSDWRIVGGSGAGIFAIDTASGRITVADPARLTRSDATSYALLVTVGDGLARSEAATVTLEIRPSGRLVNIATRAWCSTGNGLTIGGLVITGQAPKRVLVRAVGPSLAAQGIAASEVLPDPTVEVHQGAATIAMNDDWEDTANSAEITAVSAEIGATALQPGDLQSSALLLTLSPGVYTFVVSGKGGAGVVLLEVYDADMTAGGAAFVNLATRATVTTGSGIAIGGFVIAGTGPKRVLLRAVGPTLATEGLGQAEVLADPMIELHRDAAVVAANDDWTGAGNAGDIVDTSARLGATPLAAADTKSAALLLTLQPGVYSFIASGKNSTSGIVLVEVYDAD